MFTKYIEKDSMMNIILLVINPGFGPESGNVLFKLEILFSIYNLNFTM